MGQRDDHWSNVANRLGLGQSETEPSAPTTDSRPADLGGGSSQVGATSSGGAGSSRPTPSADSSTGHGHGSGSKGRAAKSPGGAYASPPRRSWQDVASQLGLPSVAGAPSEVEPPRPATPTQVSPPRSVSPARSHSRSIAPPADSPSAGDPSLEFLEEVPDFRGSDDRDTDRDSDRPEETDENGDRPARTGRRRRRGRRRGGGRGERETRATGVAGEPLGTSELTEDALGSREQQANELEDADRFGDRNDASPRESAEEEADSSETRSRSGRGGRRRRRGRGGRRQSEGAATSESPEMAGTAGEPMTSRRPLPADAVEQSATDLDHGEEGDDDATHRFDRKLPSWQDTVGIVVERNVRNHARAGQGSGGPRGGGGRRRRPGGNRRP